MRVEPTRRAVSAVTVTGAVALAAYAALVAYAPVVWTYEVWAALVFVPLLLLANVPLLLRAGRRDHDPRFLTLLLVAFAFKIVATVARYLVAFVLYDGTADASAYDGNGARLAEAYRDGLFSAEIGKDFIGTGFIRVLTGVVYTVTGQSVYVAFAVFSCMSFWGVYFLYRAFVVAVPDGDARRYALLVFFLPSMLFWPSSLGKEAWMTLGLGLAAYGAARVLSGRAAGAWPLLAGLLATSMIRPHITAAFFAALAAAYLVRRRTTPATMLTPLVTLAALAVLAVGSAVAVTQAAKFLDIDEVSVSSVESAVQGTTERTDEGGSGFAGEGASSPADLPRATVTVLVRPFVTEVSNPQMAVAALEGLLLVVLVLVSWRRLTSLPGRLRRQPYLLICLVYALIFIYAFSNFSNFGILTRQRVQVLPFVLVVLALPRPGLRRPRPTRSTRSTRPEPHLTTGVPA